MDLFMIPALAAPGRPVGGTDQNRILSVGVPSLAPGTFHTGKHLHLSECLVEANSAHTGVCVRDEHLV